MDSPLENAPSPAESVKKGRKRVRKFTSSDRALHRMIEKQRREDLNDRFLDLARLLPALAAVRRLSKSIIVTESIAHLKKQRTARLNGVSKIRDLLAERDQLLDEVNKWRQSQHTTLATRRPVVEVDAAMCELFSVEHEQFGSFPSGFGDNSPPEGADGLDVGGRESQTSGSRDEPKKLTRTRSMPNQSMPLMTNLEQPRADLHLMYPTQPSATETLAYVGHDNSVPRPRFDIGSQIPAIETPNFELPDDMDFDSLLASVFVPGDGFQATPSYTNMALMDAPGETNEVEYHFDQRAQGTPSEEDLLSQFLTVGQISPLVAEGFSVNAFDFHGSPPQGAVGNKPNDRVTPNSWRSQNLAQVDTHTSRPHHHRDAGNNRGVRLASSL